MQDFFTYRNGDKIDVVIGDCVDRMRSIRDDGVLVDAVVTDPPYEIGLYSKEWDNTGIVFQTEFWALVSDLMKPGAFLVSFSAMRTYHRVACAVEDAGFKLYPFLTWTFPGGLQKPVNISELFDRDNLPDREPIGWRKPSGYTLNNAKHGEQRRDTTEFPVYERYVSDEAKAWRGFYHGLNCLRPSMEPIILAQKPISEKRVIDNIRKHGVGALNLHAVSEDGWPTTSFHHPKARRSEHGSDHPSVKPVSLMVDLVSLVCPPQGMVLDPFAGTGTTGVACLRTGHGCILIEQDAAMEDVIKRRTSP